MGGAGSVMPGRHTLCQRTVNQPPLLVAAPTNWGENVKEACPCSLYRGFASTLPLHAPGPRRSSQGARDLGLAGLMMWDISLDSPAHDLLQAITAGGPPPARPCGGGFIGTGVCGGAAAGQCCGARGYCGPTAAECGPGCR